MKAMKNKFLKRANLFLLLAFLLVGVGACKYDDDALWDKVNSLDDRVTAVEGQLEQTNSGLSAISTILNALQNNIYVESVTETEDGYQIKFSDGESVTIKNGKDGENGKDAPVIGVDEFEGKYYWVRIIDGVKTWLTDEEGNKLPVTGEDAVTPQLKVNADGYWLVSYDGGATFDLLQDENGNPVKAIGEDGKDGVDGTDGNDGTDGDSFFSDVKVEGDELVLTLADGTVLRVAINNVEGISSPVHETSENYDITYQYNDGVIVLNERAQAYLEKVEEDSILFFSPTTPANILPDVGDIISAKTTEKTPYGLGNEVISRTEEDGLIKCVTSVAPLDDIFKVLELTSSFSLTDLVEDEGGFYDEEGNYYEYTIENVDEVMAEAGTYWAQAPSRVSIGSKEALVFPLNKSTEVGPYADLSLIAGGILTFNKSKEDDTFENSVELSVGVLGQLGIRGEKLSDEASYTNKVADLLSLINRTQLFAGTVPIAGGIINLRPFVDFKADIVGKGNVSLGIYRNVSFKCGWTENGWFVKDTSPDFSLESIFDSFKVEGKIEVGPKFAFILGCGLYTKNLAMMLNVEPSLMFGANLGMDAERNDNNLSFNIGGQVANLNLGIDAVGEIYAKLFNHVLYDNEVNVRAWTILQKEIPIFPKLENGSLNVALASENPLVFDAQYTATGGALVKLLGGMPSMKVNKDDAEVYHIIDGQEINWTTPTTLNYELTDLEKNVTYTAVPCIYIGDACYEWEGVDFSSEGEEDERLDDVLPEEIRKEIEEYVPIYNGVNPPNIEGTYLASPIAAVYCGDGRYDPGDRTAYPLTFYFYNQNMVNNTLDYQSKEGSVASFSGNGVFISGSGNNFTIFFNATGVDHGVKATTATIVSGTKTEEGIKDLYYVHAMVEKDDPSGILMNEGVVRIFKDEDGLSTSASRSAFSRSMPVRDYVSPLIRGINYKE